MLDTATSTEPIVVEMDDGATGAVDASNAQDNHENIESGSSRCSSPLQIPSSRLQSPQRPTLGVYFCPEDGERNDVLAALRVLRRQIKQTKETLRMSKMPMAQTRDIAFTLQLQDSQISQWLHLGCNIDPKKTISVKGLPIYDRMARYMSFIRDVEFDLSTPNAVEKRVRGGSFLRRFSSSDSSRSNNNKGANTVTDMRLAIASQRINASFQELKDAMEKFMREQAKEKALVEKASRVRAELGIAHTLCLPGTRARTLDAIRTWATPGDDTTPQILCLVGAGSHGKSTIASTIACEWQGERRLYGAFFFVKNPETPYKGKNACIAQPTALRPRSTTVPSLRYSIASLSQLGQRFPSSSKFRKWTLPTAPPSSSSNESSLRKLNEAIKSLSSEAMSVEEGQRHEASSPKPTFLVIDNLDDLPVSEINQVVSRLREALVANPQLRVLLTARTKSAEIVERNNDGGGEREGRETEGAEPWWAKPFMSANKTSLSPSRALFSSFSIERASSFSSSKGDNTEDKVKNTDNEEVNVDIETYVHSRMCFSLSTSEQQRLVNGAGGCIGTAVRLCDALEDAGSPERVLDVVLYREMVQKHGENIRVVLV